MNRRSLIIGAAGVAAGRMPIVRAESSDLIAIPTSVFAARRWATETFTEMPGCRLVFDNGHTYEWMKYANVSRPIKRGDYDGPKSYAIAIEIAVTDRDGHRSVHSIPVDGYGLDVIKVQREERQRAEAARQHERWRMLRGITGIEDI